ncbi:HK97 family phage prohead protease [Acinetobacter higginsii]|uniref:HK97 family phage prohead protease n=1 Tax=Acinetobacter higginsii TaxID=70347 RepID=UPI001F4A421D|nr:HK97 family phage prohead protease [Acinetobacter higginsii]MCH7381170.1 HK97 family phage prohead protease [Acinetobacter higginsii]
MNQKLQVRNKALPNLPKVQCRRMPIAADNCRFIQKDEKTGNVRISGYAVKWDSINYYGEKFIRGAFAEVCAAFVAGTKKVHCYYNHGWRQWFVDSRLPMRVGRIVELKEDDTGLYLVIEFTPGLSIAQDVAAMVLHGTIDGFSIAFYPPNSLDMEDKGTHQEIKRADIYEISVVDEPADSAARILNDDAIDAIESEDDAEELIRSMGFYGEYAKKLMSRLSGIQKPPDGTKTEFDPLAWLDS